MFLGEYEHSLDDKGRLAIPARFRAGLADGLYLTRGLDRCLVIWPPDAWRAMSDRLNGLSIWQAEARRLQRLFFSGAVNLVPDKLGRVVVPQYLREYAELADDAVVVGVHDRVEIWSKARWDAESGDYASNAAELAEHLASQGL